MLDLSPLGKVEDLSERDKMQRRRRRDEEEREEEEGKKKMEKRKKKKRKNKRSGRDTEEEREKQRDTILLSHSLFSFHPQRPKAFVCPNRPSNVSSPPTVPSRPALRPLRPTVPLLSPDYLRDTTRRIRPLRTHLRTYRTIILIIFRITILR